MKNLLGKFHAELSQQRLASQAEPSQAEPSQAEPSRAKPSQAKFAYHGLPRLTTAYHGLPLLTTAYHGLFFRVTHQSKVHTIIHPVLNASNLTNQYISYSMALFSPNEIRTF